MFANTACGTVWEMDEFLLRADVELVCRKDSDHRLLWRVIEEAERMEGERACSGRAGPSMVRLVDKVRADAQLANVVHLAALQHLEDNDSVELDAIVAQLRRLSGRLEKRAEQADQLTVVGGRA